MGVQSGNRAVPLTAISIASILFLLIPIAVVGEDSPDPPKLVPLGEASESAIWCKVTLPLESILNQLEQFPTSFTYGLRGTSIGRNGERQEVEGREIFVPGKNDKVNETKFNFFDGFGTPAGGGFESVGLQYFIFRSPLVPGFDSSTGNLRLSSDFEFKCEATAHNGIWLWGGSGWGDEWPRRLNMTLASKLSATPDYRLSAITTANAKMKTDFVIHGSALAGLARADFNAAPFFERELNKALTPLANAVNRMTTEISLKPVAQRAWNRLHEPVQISDGLFVQLTPKQFAMSHVFLEDKNKLSVWCGVFANTLLTDKTKPMREVDLPPLEIVDAVDKRFSINAGIEVTDKYLNHAAAKLSGQSFTHENALVTLGKIKVKIVDNGIEMKLDNLKINQGTTRHTVSGTLVARPAIEQRKDRYILDPVLEIKELTWEDSFTKLIASLFENNLKETLQRALSKGLEIDLTEQMNRLLPAKIQVAEGTELSIDEPVISFGKFKSNVEASAISLNVKATGKATLILAESQLNEISFPKNEELKDNNGALQVGGPGGNVFRTEAKWPNFVSGIEISANRDNSIFGIGVIYAGLDAARFGRMEDRITKLCLERNEYIRKVWVKSSGQLIDEIAFETNKKGFGPYGKGNPNLEWQKFNAPEDSEIIGFHGGAGHFIDRIGVIVRKRL